MRYTNFSLQKHNIPHTFVEEPGKHDWGFCNKDIQRVPDWLPLCNGGVK